MPLAAIFRPRLRRVRPVAVSTGALSTGMEAALAGLAGICLLAVAGLVPTPAAAQSKAPEVKIVDEDLYERAFAAVSKGRLSEARRIGKTGKDAVLTKILDWYYFQEINSGASFDQIAKFVTDNPGWPHRSRLLLHAEREMPTSTTDEDLVAWFATHSPRTQLGQERYARALLRLAEKEGATAGAEKRLRAQLVIRQIWTEEAFRGKNGARDARGFRTRYKEHLREEDHWHRAQAMMWKGRTSAAKDLLDLLTDDHKKIITAWSKLTGKKLSKSTVEGALGSVSEELRVHPGIQYAYMLWLVKNGRKREAHDVMMKASRRGPLGNAQKWWLARNDTVRSLLADKEYQKAYVLAAHHGLKEGKHFAEAEFLLGWIALRFLNQPREALKHFLRLHAGVQYPISQSRAAYWSARANAALGDNKAAAKWYAEAARYPSTFYGQLSAVNLGEGFNPPLSAEINEKDRAAFEANELTQAVRKLEKLGASRTGAIFLRQTFRAAQTPAARTLAVNMTLEFGEKRLAVATAKLAHRKGDPLVSSGYPVLKMEPFEGDERYAPDESLTLGLIRQESMFDEDAMSWVGARGLMQLMPPTAREVARNIKVRYNPRALTRDPHYNMKLGRHYLSGRLKEFRGYYPMVLAAYNAGPGRVRQWMDAYGDPRKPGAKPEDMVDWIEHIPFDETRAYVMRVIENVMVYRWKLGEAPLVPETMDEMFRPLPNANRTLVAGAAVGSKGGIKPGTAAAAQKRRTVAQLAQAPSLPPVKSPILLEATRKILVRPGTKAARAAARAKVTERPNPNPLRGKRAWPSPPKRDTPLAQSSFLKIKDTDGKKKPSGGEDAEKPGVALKSPTAPPDNSEPGDGSVARQKEAEAAKKTGDTAEKAGTAAGGFPKGPVTVTVSEAAKKAGKKPQIAALPRKKPDGTDTGGAEGKASKSGSPKPKPKVTSVPRPNPLRKSRRNPDISAVRSGDNTWPAQVAGN